jgi:hypothetical protein
MHLGIGFSAVSSHLARQKGWRFFQGQVLRMWAGSARHLALKKMMQAQLLVLFWLLFRHGALSSGI